MSTAISKNFYGNKAAVACFFIMFFHLGLIGTVGLFIPEWVNEMKAYTLGQISFMVTVGSISSFIFNLFAGRIISKFGAKKTLLLASVFGCIHFVTYGMSHTPYGLYLGAALSGIPFAYGTHTVNATLISQWFIEKRASILGYVFGGASLGCALVVYLAGILIAKIGWHNTYFVLSAAWLIFGCGINLLFIKTPEQMGQKPLGWEKQDEIDKLTKDNEASKVGVDYSTALKSVAFWLLFISLVTVGMLITGFKTFAPTFWRTNGVTPIMASMYISIFLLISTAATMVSGKIAEKFGNKVFLLYLYTSFIVGLGIVIYSVTHLTPLIIIISIAVVGIAYPLYGTIPAQLTTNTFGDKDYAKISAQMMSAFYIGLGLVSPVFSAIFARTKSFVPIFMLLMVLAVIACVLQLIALKISPLNRIYNKKEGVSL